MRGAVVYRQVANHLLLSTIRSWVRSPEEEAILIASETVFYSFLAVARYFCLFSTVKCLNYLQYLTSIANMADGSICEPVPLQKGQFIVRFIIHT